MTELDINLLISAYRHGIFPMGHEDDVYWYDPESRAVLPLEQFHVSRSLKRLVSRQPFEIRVNTAFSAVIEGCAAPAPGREKTWITSTIRTAYLRLHQLGYAHSVEAWRQQKLVGGLYGVAIRGLFAGESMFSQASNASKVCLVHLVHRMRDRGMNLLDVQFMTDHLRQFGAVEISRAEYHRRLRHALRRPVNFA